MLRQKHYTVRGGNVVQYHPPGLPLPDTLPAAAELFDTGKQKPVEGLVQRLDIDWLLF